MAVPAWRSRTRTVRSGVRGRTKVPAAVRGIALARRRRPGGDEPMEAGPRRSGDGGFGTPAELGAVAPEAMQEHGELAGDRDLGLLEAAALSDREAPAA